jgi:thiamine kinase-like enzyme
MSEAKVSHEDLIRNLPCWTGSLDIEPMHGGLSNVTFLVKNCGQRSVVRLGQDYPFHHVNRAREVMTAQAAHHAGFGPKVIYSQPGVLVSDFIDGKTFHAQDVRMNGERIAKFIAQFHTEMGQHITGSAYMFWVFHVIRDYARTLSQTGGPWTDMLDGYVLLAGELESAQAPLPIVFGHNDLLPANFLDDGSRLWLIDYEYAGFTTSMFDVAGVSANADMDSHQSELFLNQYFDGQSGSQSAQINRSFLAMQCAAALREAMWAMVSHVYLKTPGVDYGTYADDNLVRFARMLENYRKAI